MREGGVRESRRSAIGEVRVVEVRRSLRSDGKVKESVGGSYEM